MIQNKLESISQCHNHHSYSVSFLLLVTLLLRPVPENKGTLLFILACNDFAQGDAIFKI